MIANFNTEEQDWNRVYRIAAHFPGTAAARVFAHIGQRYLTSELYKYNYGPQENINYYGQPIPPIYDLSKITNRYIVLFRGTNDILADYADLQHLKKTLKGKKILFNSFNQSLCFLSLSLIHTLFFIFIKNQFFLFQFHYMMKYSLHTVMLTLCLVYIAMLPSIYRSFPFYIN